MTDHHLPSLTDDDLSAHLDGEAEPGVADRIAADPAAQARLAEVRRARDLVAASDPPPLPADAAERAIGAALDAAGPEAEPVPTPRRSRRSGPPPIAVAAAVLVLLAVGLALVWSGTRNDASETAGGTVSRAEVDAPTESAADSDGAGSGASRSEPAGGAAPTTVASPHGGGADVSGSNGQAFGTPIELLSLGTFESPDALRTAIATGFPETGRKVEGTARTNTDDASIARCSQLLQSIFRLTEPQTRTAVATVAGDRLLVYEFPAPVDTTTTAPTPPATVLTLAVKPKACDVVLAFQR